MTDSSTSQSNPSFLPEAESSVIPLGLHNPLLTPDALGQGQSSASLIPLGSRRITVLDPSFFQRKPILQEGSELYDSDFFAVDTINSGNAPESLISSSYSSKIQRSSLPKIQSQKSLSLISNLDRNSLLSKSSIDSSNLISDSTNLSNIDSSEFQSSLPTNNVQLKREEESTQLPYTAQRKSDLSTHSSNNVLDITSLDQDLGHSVEWVEIKPDLKISDQPVQRSSIKEVSDSTQNTIRSESVIQSNRSDVEDSRISFPVSVEQVGLLPSSSTINLQFQLEVEKLVQTPITVKPTHQSTEQEIQRLSALEDSNSVQLQSNLSQPEQQSANSHRAIDREPIQIQRSNSTKSLTQGSSFDLLSTIDIQSKLESEEFNQSPSLIQKFQETVTSSQANLGEAITIEPTTHKTRQEIQRFSAIEDSISVQIRSDSSQPKNKSLDSAVELDQQFTQIQRSTPSESTNQDLLIQLPSNIDTESKLESQELSQTSNLIQKNQEANISSQTDSNIVIAIEPIHSASNQEIQRFSIIEDSSSAQAQIDLSQLEYPSVTSAMEIDREPTPIQRSTPTESINKDLSIYSASNIDIPFKLESASFDQPSSLIQRYPEAVIASQTNLEGAIEPANQTMEQQIQIVSVPEDSNVVQRQIDLFQPEQQSLSPGTEIDRQSTQIEPTPIQPSNSPESLTQDSSIQSGSTVDIPFKLESEAFSQPSSLIQIHQKAAISSQTNLSEALEPIHNTSNQEIQRFSIIEDSSPDPAQIDSSHLEHSSVNSPMEIEREFTQIQRVTSSESTKKDLSIQLVSNVDIQSKLGSESFDQTSSLIQRYHDIPTSPQTNLEEAIAIESANQTTDQQIQKFSEAQNSNSGQTQIDSSQPTYQTVNDAVGIDRKSITMQRSNYFESTNQDLLIQPPSNIDIQSKLESESFDQNSSLIQGYQEIPPSSQPNSSEAIEPTNQTIEQQIQRLSATKDSSSSQVQIDPPQAEQQLVSPGIEIERQSITIQRSTSTEFVDKNLSIQSASSIDIQSKPESFDQPSRLIHKYQEAVTSSQENLGEPIAIESANQSPEQQIQRLLVTGDSEDPNVIQRQIDLSQPEQQPVNSVGGSDREPPQIKRLTIAPYLIQDSEQSITKLEDTGSPSIDTIGPEDKRPDQTIQRSSPIDSSNVDKIRINLSKSVDQEVSSWVKNDRHSIENQLLSSLPSEDKALYSQLSPSMDLQFKLEPDALNLLPNLIQKSQESPSSSPTPSNISATEDILEISNDRIDIVSPKPEHHISDQLIQRSSAIEVPDQMSIGSSYLEIQSVNLIDKSSPSINKSLNSNTIKRTQESSSYKVQSIDSDFPIEKSVSKSPNEPTSSINISIQDDITIDPDYIQRSSLSESQSEQPESSAISQQPEIEKLPNVFKNISILKPLIQPSLQRSILDISSTPRKLDPEPLNIWSTILQPRPQSHAPSSNTDSINSSSHSENLDNYHVINPSSPYNLNAKSDISVVMNSPQEWSSLESLVQMNSEPQKETLQRQALESYPQIVSSQSTSNHNISNQSTISHQEVSIQRNTYPFSSSVESDQNYVEINSDRDPKFDREEIAKSEQFEALAQEIYSLLRQRLVIDQERQGSGYSGRLPW